MNFWNDWHDKATGEKTQSERKAESRDRNQRTEQSREEQDKYHEKGDREADNAGHGYDPATINQRDSWSSWDHKQMKTMVDSVDTGAINDKGSDWLSVGKSMAKDFEQFQSEVSGAVKGGWTGNAATAAATAPDGLAQWGTAMASASQGTGSRMQQASTAAEQAKINMPEPKEFSWRRSLVNGAGGLLTGGFGGGIAAGGGDAYAQHKEAQQAKQQAVNVMNRMYTEGYVEVDRTTPAFVAPKDDRGGNPPPPGKTPPPHAIIEPRPVPPPTHRGGGDPNDTGSDDNGRSGDPNHPGRTDITDPSQVGPRDNDPNNPPTDTGNPGRTDPNQYDPRNPNNPANPQGNQQGAGHGGGGGGGGMGGGMPMMGGGAGGVGGSGDSEYGGRGYGGRGSGMGGGAGSGASESGSGGRSGIGGSAAQEAMGGRGGAGVGGAGAGGAGRGGMGGGGRGGRKEEDTEHESPDYLVETDDVFGSGEMVAPPVIGGE